MIYVFSELDMITPLIYQNWLNQASAQKREQILKYKFFRDRLLCVSAYRLLCFALKEDNVEFSYNEYKKPILKNGEKCFNITHCDGLVACITADSPVGIDAELLRPYPQKVLKRIFTENEIQQIVGSKNPDYAFFTFWTLKESYVKARGEGMHFPPRNVEFTLSNDGISCSDKKFMFTSYGQGNHVISSCSDDSQVLVAVGLAELLI